MLHISHLASFFTFFFAPPIILSWAGAPEGAAGRAPEGVGPPTQARFSTYSGIFAQPHHAPRQGDRSQAIRPIRSLTWAQSPRRGAASQAARSFLHPNCHRAEGDTPPT